MIAKEESGVFEPDLADYPGYARKTGFTESIGLKF